MNSTTSISDEEDPSHSGIGLNDILYIVFRHKWKILLCAVAGLAAAAGVYFLTARDYESQAKLLVRYVVERSAIDAVDPTVRTGGSQTDSIINSEVEILTSMDLAVQVADAVGVERLGSQSAGVGAKAAAVESVFKGLTVGARKGNNVISVAFRNRDPQLARTVLEELVKRYFDKHLEVHRSLGAFDFVSQQTDQIRSRLRLTEDELKKLKADSGILSLTDSTASVNARMARCEDELLTAEAELAQQQARLKETERLLAGGNPSQPKDAPNQAEGSTPPSFRSAVPLPASAPGKNPGAPAPPAMDSRIGQRHQLLVERGTELRKAELDLLARYTPQSQLVKSTRSQIEDLDRERHELETKFPVLLTALPKTTGDGGRPQSDLSADRASLGGLAAKVEVLKAQLRATAEQAGRLAQVGPQIMQLERKKEVEETNVKYFESSLEKARVDEALDPSKIPNISVIQKPTDGMKVTGETKKLVLGLACGGVGLGVALALLIELVLNRSVRRPLELETRLRIPQLLSIPWVPDRERSRLQLQNGDRVDADSKAVQAVARPAIATWSPDHFLRAFTDEIRDRLILSFQLKNLTHKPKLVGIAGLAGGEGTSTLAGGLAAALSETGDGKVLLVDMNSRHAEAHSFSDGYPALGLAEALQANGSLPPAAENLYLATGASHNGSPTQLAAKRFYALVPNLKDSHFDYIIFDLPPVTMGSATLAIAGCLDKLLFVVEAGKSDRDEVKRAYTELVAAKADVAGILNKTRASGPKWLNA